MKCSARHKCLSELFRNNKVYVQQMPWLHAKLNTKNSLKYQLKSKNVLKKHKMLYTQIADGCNCHKPFALYTSSLHYSWQLLWLLPVHVHKLLKFCALYSRAGRDCKFCTINATNKWLLTRFQYCADRKTKTETIRSGRVLWGVWYVKMPRKCYNNKMFATKLWCCCALA